MYLKEVTSFIGVLLNMKYGPFLRSSLLINVDFDLDSSKQISLQQHHSKKNLIFLFNLWVDDSRSSDTHTTHVSSA